MAFYLRGYQKQRSVSVVDLEAVGEERGSGNLNIHLTEQHLILELVDTIVRRVGMQENI